MNRARGQTLLMLVLTLLFLSLTVMVTLGVASRVHDRMEAQVAADTAAYSEAVLTARTFNAVAVINRASIGQMVAMAAVESFISWTGASYGNFIAIPLAITKGQADGSLAGCDAAITQLEAALTAAQKNADKIFQDDDQAAGDQARNLQGTASALRDVQLKLVSSLVSQLAQNPIADVPDNCPACNKPMPPLLSGMSPKNMVREIARGANTQLDTPDKAGDWKSIMEVEAAAALNTGSATTDAVYATMGSIGDPFVNSRANGSGAFASGMTNVYGAVGFTGGSSGGGAGFGSYTAGFPASEKIGSASSYAAWAEDKGGSFSFTLQCASGPRTVTGTTTDAYVYSSEEQQTDDKHVYQGSDAKPPEERHTMGACVVCDGIWPFFLDYTLSASGSTDQLGRPVNTRDNLLGQPVLYAMVQRDYSQIRSDPWSMRFDFHFTSEGASFDNGSKAAGSKVQLGKTDDQFSGYTRQVALSAGLAYYHRHGHAKEPPNFFNPFWRATLIPAETDTATDVDSGAGGDAVRALNRAGFPQHAAALQQLEQQGYRVTELSP